MAKQWQIRRGTTGENDQFTGAAGELTMDTTLNGLRIHDGVTEGGVEIPTASTADYVVLFRAPTYDNNYRWYRVYKSGWVEEGGPVSGGASATVTLPIAMKDSNYTLVLGNTSVRYEQIRIISKTATAFTVSNADGGGTVSGFWQASGISSQE